MKSRQRDAEYKQDEMDADAALLNSYEAVLKQVDLTGKEQQEKFTANYQRYHTSYERLAASLKSINSQISEYDACMETIHSIDEENSKKYTAEMREYYDIQDRYMERN